MLQNQASGNESFDQQPVARLALVCHGDGDSDITIENYRKREMRTRVNAAETGEQGKVMDHQMLPAPHERPTYPQHSVDKSIQAHKIA